MFGAILCQIYAKNTFFFAGTMIDIFLTEFLEIVN